MERLIRQPARLGRTGASDVLERWSFTAYVDRLESAWMDLVG